MNWYELLNVSMDDLRGKFPVIRRFLDQGFVLSPTDHAENQVGLQTLNQRIRLNLKTGEFVSLQ